MNPTNDKREHALRPLYAARKGSGRGLHGQVARGLAGLILSGEVAPGDALPNEEKLSTDLGVSRTALREAIRTLAAKGLLESRPKVGTRVRSRDTWNMLDPDILGWLAAGDSVHAFARNLLEMRKIIEPAAAALAAERRSAAQLAIIEAACDAMAAAPDREAWSTADLHFHQAILAATGNELLNALGATIGAALDIGFRFAAHGARSFRNSLPLHEAILDAIRAGDAERAHAATAYLLADAARTLDIIATASGTTEDGKG